MAEILRLSLYIKPASMKLSLWLILSSQLFPHPNEGNAPGGTRTHGPRIRNPVLYPTELRGRTVLFYSVRGTIARFATRVKTVEAGQEAAEKTSEIVNRTGLICIGRSAVFSLMLFQDPRKILLYSSLCFLNSSRPSSSIMMIFHLSASASGG